MMSEPMTVESHAMYVREVFGALFDWERISGLATELMGSIDFAVAIGLDQLGHFGPQGVRLVAQRLVAAADGPLARIVELGSGFAGATRHMFRELKTKDVHGLLVGVDIVHAHSAHGGRIGRSIEETDPRLVTADAASLPFPAGSIDAFYAVGAASHFVSVGRVLAECARVLRPGGVVVMVEEVSLHPADGPEPGLEFQQYHPFVRVTAVDERRADFQRAGLEIDAFESLAEWAEPLLKQRIQGMRMLSHCGQEMYGADRYARLMTMISSAADEYARKSIEPVLVVARRPR